MVAGTNVRQPPAPIAPNVKPDVEKTLLIEFDNENNQANKVNAGKNKKEDSEDNHISKTQATTVQSSVRSEKTQASKEINIARLKSAESSKVPSSGKSEESQKSESKTTIAAQEPESTTGSKL